MQLGSGYVFSCGCVIKIKSKCFICINVYTYKMQIIVLMLLC